MRPRFSHFLVLSAALLLAGAALFVAACGGSEATTTTVAVTATTSGVPAGASNSLAVKGLVDNPAPLAPAELQSMDLVTISAEHPKLGMQEYTGVRFADLFAKWKVQSAATTLIMAASDGFMAEVALSDIKASADAMLAIGDDGKLNVVIPGMASKTWVKDVVSMEFK